jgi:hypothetical protein
MSLDRTVTRRFLTLFLVVAALLFCQSAASDDKSPERAAVLEARQAQDSIDRVTEEMMRKLTELEVEYHKKKQPLFVQRNIVLKKVDHFWARVIENHPSHEAWFRGSDKEALQYLTDVQITDLPNDQDDAHLLHHYRLELHFAPNAFFSNAVLWRDVRGHAHDDGLSEVSGVTWFEGRTPAEVSFFNFFEKSNVRSSAPRLEDHFISEVGHIFRYEFWPNPFTYHDLPQYQELMQQHREGDYYAQENGESYSELDDHTVDREPVEADEVYESIQIPEDAIPETADEAEEGAEI